MVKIASLFAVVTALCVVLVVLVRSEPKPAAPPPGVASGAAGGAGAARSAGSVGDEAPPPSNVTDRAEDLHRAAAAPPRLEEVVEPDQASQDEARMIRPTLPAELGAFRQREGRGNRRERAEADRVRARAPDPEIARVQEHIDRGEVTEAHLQAMQLLEEGPPRRDALRLAVTTACLSGNADDARKLAEAMPQRERARVAAACSEQGIDLGPAPAGAERSFRRGGGRTGSGRR
jgi:hypothetical protein